MKFKRKFQWKSIYLTLSLSKPWVYSFRLFQPSNKIIHNDNWFLENECRHSGLSQFDGWRSLNYIKIFKLTINTTVDYNLDLIECEYCFYISYLSENFLYYKSLKPSSCRMLAGYLVSYCKWMEMYIIVQVVWCCVCAIVLWVI